MLTSSTRLPLDVFGNTADSEANNTQAYSKNGAEYSEALAVWYKLRDEAQRDPNDIAKWRHLFTRINDRLAEVNEKQLNYEFKSFIHKCYSDLLVRFPHLVSFWREFATMEYRLHGLDASIKVLRKAVEACEYTIDLWVDFLSALIVQYDEDRSTDLKEEIIAQFEKCLGLNKYNFNSYHIYNKFFEFKQKVDHKFQHSKQYFDYVLELMAIPTYEYSKYYQIFNEIQANFQLAEKIDPEALEEYLKKFEKKLEQLLEIEEGQIIQEFGYKIFMKTQTRVNEKWEYEASITAHELILDSDIVDQEVQNWVKYLNYEIANYESDRSCFPIVTNLFERCLIPNCYNSKIWLKYIAFLNFSHLAEDEKFDSIDAVYQKASSYVPLDDNSVRFSYGDFLLKFDKLDTLNSHFLDLITYFSGKNRSHLYFLSYYLESVDNLLKLWAKASDITKLQQLLSQTIQEYFAKIDSYKPNTSSMLEAFDDKLLTKESLSCLQKLLNDQSIVVVINRYLNLVMEDFNIEDDNKVRNLRQFFNKYYKEDALKYDKSFWAFFIRLEGIIMFDYMNLKFVINYVKNNLLLPKEDIDNFVTVHYNITSANYREVLTANPTDNTLLAYSNDTSMSLLQNNSLLKRTSNNNSKVTNKPTANKTYSTKASNYLSIVRSHFENPGITIDAKPDITNKLMMNDVDLLDDDIPIPPLPAFKNVEKANQPIYYPA